MKGLTWPIRTLKTVSSVWSAWGNPVRPLTFNFKWSNTCPSLLSKVDSQRRKEATYSVVLGRASTTSSCLKSCFPPRLPSTQRLACQIQLLMETRKYKEIYCYPIRNPIRKTCLIYPIRKNGTMHNNPSHLYISETGCTERFLYSVRLNIGNSDTKLVVSTTSEFTVRKPWYMTNHRENPEAPWCLEICICRFWIDPREIYVRMSICTGLHCSSTRVLPETGLIFNRDNIDPLNIPLSKQLIQRHQ